jgi:plastocyanin
VERGAYLALAAAMLLAVSCGDSSRRQGAEAAAVKPRPATHTVMMEAVSFKPEVLTVNRGDSILWINKDPFPHTARASGGFDSREMAPDASWTFTATAAGELRYVCAFHPTMTGRIVVR